MQPDKDSSAEDRSRNRGPAGKKENIDSIVNELRNVLSGLGKEPPKEVEKKQTLSPIEATPTEPFSTPFASDNLRLTEPPSSQKGMPIGERPPVSDTNSDADFWNGNVLGWGQNEVNLSDEPAKPAALAPEPDAPSLRMVKPEPPAEPSARSFADEWLARPGAPAANGTETKSPPPPKNGADHGSDRLDVIPTLPKNDFSFSQENNGHWMPEPPPSPSSGSFVTEEEPLNNSNGSSSPLIQFDAFDERESSAPITDHAPSAGSFRAPARDDSRDQKAEIEKTFSGLESDAESMLMVPIPGTIDREQPSALEEPGAPTARSVPTTGALPIACIFPKGEEKKGQFFVARLREAAQKFGRGRDVETTYVQAWTASDADLPTWAQKARSLGARVIFVLASKTELPALESRLNGAGSSGLRWKFIKMEHIGSKTLYADILLGLDK